MRTFDGAKGTARGVDLHRRVHFGGRGPLASEARDELNGCIQSSSRGLIPRLMSIPACFLLATGISTPRAGSPRGSISALVEEDLGREVALAVARTMVVFPHRPGGHSPFRPQLKF